MPHQAIERFAPTQMASAYAALYTELLQARST